MPNTGSWGCDKQLGTPDQVVGCHGEGERPADATQTALSGFAQAGGGLDPAERLLDALGWMIWLTLQPAWQVVRPSMAEPLSLAATCGVTLNKRSSLTKSSAS